VGPRFLFLVRGSPNPRTRSFQVRGSPNPRTIGRRRAIGRPRPRKVFGLRRGAARGPDLLASGSAARQRVMARTPGAGRREGPR
jgi:hypothetical protein